MESRFKYAFTAAVRSLDHVALRDLIGSGHAAITMLRREPTLIQIDQNAIKEVKAALEPKDAENDSMLVDGADGSPAQKQPYNAVEEDKKRRALLTRNQRMGIAD